MELECSKGPFLDLISFCVHRAFFVRRASNVARGTFFAGFPMH